jgi:hypothetical protein
MAKVFFAPTRRDWSGCLSLAACLRAPIGERKMFIYPEATQLGE